MWSQIDSFSNQPRANIRARPISGEQTSYVFNASGQEIRLDGLLCLFDEVGPCANAVKDAQRIKTHPGTTRTLSMIWGTTALPGRSDRAAAWYCDLIERLGGHPEVLVTGG